MASAISQVCGKCGKCCATSRAVRTPGMNCLTVNNLVKLFSQQIELHSGDDCVTSMDGVCDADGVLAAALPCSYLKVRALNFTKLLPRPELGLFCGDAPMGVRDSICLREKAIGGGALEML